ncbi:MAG TPA: hypothetical protein VGC72_03730 [Candidatus Elarobacter sp.]|jgi:hypothetical protein
MGREARCTASWGARRGDVTALLESTELIVRGAFRASAPLASLQDVRAAGGTLFFRSGDEDVALVLGAAAPRWAAALATPPPSVATKLGIAGKRVLVEGALDDEALAAAVATAAQSGEHDAELIVARVDDGDELARIASERRALLEAGVPMWVVYTKGARGPLGETAVRALLRERGLMDLKVASVSATLTALKFARKRAR